jgi:hypothetical protein
MEDTVFVNVWISTFYSYITRGMIFYEYLQSYVRVNLC